MTVAKDNLEKMIKIAEGIEFKRDIADFIEYLAGTDYFAAPAAKGHHDAVDGGLFRHSNYMYEALLKMNEMIGDKYSKETLFIVAFGHDVCKTGIYQYAEQYYKDKGSTQWKTRPGWDIVDSFPMGHGEKSVFIVSQYLKLELEEILAIRWHMGAFEVGVILDPTIKYSYQEAQNISPLVRMAHCADLMAVTMTQVYNGDK